MKDEGIKEVLQNDIYWKGLDLQENWPNLDEYPDDVQLAMFDVHFNTGRFTPARWGKFKKAYDKKDFPKMSQEISRVTPHQKRNDEVIKMIHKYAE